MIMMIMIEKGDNKMVAPSTMFFAIKIGENVKRVVCYRHIEMNNCYEELKKDYDYIVWKTCGCIRTPKNVDGIMDSGEWRKDHISSIRLIEFLLRINEDDIEKIIYSNEEGD